jgi:hypothetical protein
VHRCKCLAALNWGDTDRYYEGISVACNCVYMFCIHHQYHTPVFRGYCPSSVVRRPTVCVCVCVSDSNLGPNA